MLYQTAELVSCK